MSRPELTAGLEHPLAITMWDFSWLERRWPGAGYEDWGAALDALVERGYDALRIDAYPHLVAADPTREWELLPVWSTQDWGAPARTRVRVQPNLDEFLAACGERRLRVGLSTWFRQDTTDRRLALASPADLGAAWVATLDAVQAAGLLEHVLYVDLCNEWPMPLWAPFLGRGEHEPEPLRTSPEIAGWTATALDTVRAAHPGVPVCFSHTAQFERWPQEDLRGYDLLEPHVWMAGVTDFYEQVGYDFERFDPAGYERVVERAEALYRERPDHWREALDAAIDQVAAFSRASGLPLVTTECWGPIDYKDWPGLDWGWVKELCDHGTRRAVATGRWAAVATSNFCGPQFAGMWRDIAWHRSLTDAIHAGALPAPLARELPPSTEPA